MDKQNAAQRLLRGWVDGITLVDNMIGCQFVALKVVTKLYPSMPAPGFTVMDPEHGT
jgi:hypothetical protein